MSSKIFKAQMLEIPSDISVEFIYNLYKKIDSINDNSFLLMYESFRYNTKDVDSVDIESYLKEKDLFNLSDENILNKKVAVMKMFSKEAVDKVLLNFFLTKAFVSSFHDMNYLHHDGRVFAISGGSTYSSDSDPNRYCSYIRLINCLNIL